jgi:ribonuclease HII
MESNYECITNIEDEVQGIISSQSKKKKTIAEPLKKWYLEDKETYEIGVDEVGRGPLFGRVYAAAVILPKDDDFNYLLMKDSKRFHSKKKIVEVANYIKEKAIAWSVSYEDEKSIDEINILQATQKAMHTSIKNIIQKKINLNDEKSNFQLLVDGNYFHPFKIISNNKCDFIPHVCIEGGDNKYCSIAAASILAKVVRDEYIDDLVAKNPDLSEKYGIDSNKGYGAKKHMEGIKLYGITQWHRKTFGICKSFG